MKLSAISSSASALLAAVLLSASCNQVPALPEGFSEVSRDVNICAGEIHSFDIEDPGMERTVKVDIWTPEGYPERGHKYPVIYMHDGQNVFDSLLVGFGKAWEIDDALTAMSREGQIEAPIVVATYCANTRFFDYLPAKYENYVEDVNEFANFLWRRGEYKNYSNQYLDLLANTIKPFVDERFHTDPSPEATSVMGSSMGGMISLYAMCEKPDVFGTAICLSYHFMDNGTEGYLQGIQLQHLADYLPEAGNHRIYIDRGDQDLDATYIPYFSQFENVLKEKGYSYNDMMLRTYPGFGHNEGYWARRLRIPILFLNGKVDEAWKTNPADSYYDILLNNQNN